MTRFTKWRLDRLTNRMIKSGKYICILFAWVRKSGHGNIDIYGDGGAILLTVMKMIDHIAMNNQKSFDDVITDLNKLKYDCDLIEQNSHEQNDVSRTSVSRRAEQEDADVC